MKLRWQDSGLFVLVYLCWLVGTEAQFIKHFHMPVVLFLDASGVILIALLMLWLRRRNPDRQLSVRWFWVCWGAMAALFAWLYPLAHAHTYGRGSDREDALRVASLQLIHGHFPYYVHTYLGNPISPLPGALLLATPFLALKYIGIENLFWFGLFLYVADRFFQRRAALLVLVIILMVLSTGGIDDMVVGGDSGANLSYVLISVFLFLAAHEQPAPEWQQVATEVFLGVALCSRAVYIVFLPILFAYLLQRRNWRFATRAIAVAAFVSTALALPFYLYDPSHFAPLHVEHKLDFLPAASRPVVQKLLPMASLVVACAAFWTKLTRQNVLLIAGLSLTVVLGVPGVIEGVLGHFNDDTWFMISYASLPAVLIAYWALMQLTDDRYPPQTAVVTPTRDVVQSS